MHTCSIVFRVLLGGAGLGQTADPPSGNFVWPLADGARTGEAGSMTAQKTRAEITGMGSR